MFLSGDSRGEDFLRLVELSAHITLTVSSAVTSTFKEACDYIRHTWLLQAILPSLRSDDVKVQMISSFNSTGRLSYLLPYDLKFYKFQGIGYGYLLGGHYSACNNGILPLYE